MIPGYHDQEKFAQAHRQNLLREAERERVLAQLPKPDRNGPQFLLASLTLILRSIRTSLQKLVKRRKQITKY